MNREEEIQKAIDSEFKGSCFEDEWDEIMQTGKYKKGIQWADSHPSLEVVEKIINLAFDGWDGIEDFHDLAQSIKEEIENEIP